MLLRIVSAVAFGTAGLLLLQSPGWTQEKKEEKKVDTRETVVSDLLSTTDPKDKVRPGCFCKTYVFKMQEGRTYQIDMKSTEFDSYLRVEDPAGTQVAFDDDSGGFPDARIIYRAPKGGDYTIIATTFAGGTAGKYRVIIKELDQK